jgi:hypothetical protein
MPSPNVGRIAFIPVCETSRRPVWGFPVKIFHAVIAEDRRIGRHVNGGRWWGNVEIP